MDRNVMIAYTEVDEILSLMDEQFQKKIPNKLRKLISENKLSEYNVIINPNIPLKDQKISKKALAILAVINYNYWCVEKEKKEELIKKYKNNEEIRQRKLREQYRTDNLFSNKSLDNKLNNEDKQLILYNKKEGIWLKLINKIKGLFRN